MEMLELIFDNVKQMAWSVTFIIPIVMTARLVIGRFSKNACYILWVVVALRLLFPVMLPSEVSIFKWLSQAGIRNELVRIDSDADITQITGSPVKNNMADNDMTGSNETANTYDSVNMEQYAGQGLFNTPAGANDVQTQPQNDRGLADIFDEWSIYLWLGGVAVLAAYLIIGCIVLKHKLRFATQLQEDVFESEVVDSPFVFGVLNPKIYLPYNMTEREQLYILTHEQYHIRRKDHLVKWFAFILLGIYWFHPLVWAAYILMSRDMELSCDEYVLRDCTINQRKEYSVLLLSFARQRQSGIPLTLAFGEKSIKQRIANVLQYKKKTVFSAIAAVCVLAVIAAVCLTDAGSNAQNDRINPETDNTVISDTPITDKNDAETTDIKQAAEEIFDARNPYIGNASANGRLINAISKYYDGFKESYTTELNTDVEPYSIKFHFSETPDLLEMWKSAAVFIALTENCGGVSWDYEFELGGRWQAANVWVNMDSINEILDLQMPLKAYAQSEEMVQKLLERLDAAEIDYEQILVSISDGGEQIFSKEEYTRLTKELLQELPDTVDEAELRDDIFLIKAGGEVVNPNLWKEFVKSSSTGKQTAEVIIGRELRYEGIEYHYLRCDSEKFSFLRDESRVPHYGSPRYYQAAFSTLYIYNEVYSDIEFDETELSHHFSNGLNGNIYIISDYAFDKDYTNTVIVILDNDPSLNWEHLLEASYSSQYPSSVGEWQVLFWLDNEVLAGY